MRTAQICLSALLLMSACARPNLAAIAPGKLVHGRPFYRGGIKVRRVSIVTEPHVRRSRAQKLRDTIARELEAAFPRLDKKLAPIMVDIDHDARYRTRGRLWIFDIYAGASLGLFPFNPAWGRARSSSRLTLEVPAALVANPRRLQLKAHASRPFFTIFYSWFRAGPSERAAAKANRQALRSIGDKLALWYPLRNATGTYYAPALRRRYFPYVRRGPAYVGRKSIRFDFDPKGTLVNIAGLARYNSAWRLITSDAVYDEKEEFVPPGRAKSSDTRAAQGFWRDYLNALTGLEIGYFYGAAFVSSRAVDDRGQSFRIASGRATSRGYKIRTFSPPTRSRLFIYPTLGFFSLDIDIADVAGDIPLGRVAGARDIPAIGSNPTTGERIDLGASNTYALKLRSGYIGQRFGGTLVFGNARTQLFATLEGGVNFFEWRWTKAELGRFSESGHSGVFFHSFTARWLLGFVHRPWHAAVRCLGNYEVYRQFAFPQPLPFEGRVTYNQTLKTYERREIKVDAAIVQTVNFYCGVSFHY